MSVNQMTRALADASRSETTLNFDMSMLCLKLSLVSEVFFNERVQFSLGSMEANGETPALVSPFNRFAERGVKTERALAPTPKYNFKEGERDKLLEKLEENGGGIGQVDDMQYAPLAQLHNNVFGTYSRDTCVWCSDARGCHIPHCLWADDCCKIERRDDV